MRVSIVAVLIAATGCGTSMTGGTGGGSGGGSTGGGGGSTSTGGGTGGGGPLRNNGYFGPQPAIDGGLSCDDFNACTTDTLGANGCEHVAAVTCVASDQCHDVGVCNPVSGRCTNPLKAERSACDDGNACTTNDVCQVGICGGRPVVCTASDQCHAVGVCNPANGTCSNPVKPNTATCDDGVPCTHGDVCTNGTCAGTQAVCPSDQCGLAGVCNPTTGLCVKQPKPGSDGQPCQDANLCTTNKRCSAGSCIGDPVVLSCPATDQCHVDGACDPRTGGCTNPPATDSRSCDDGQLCTENDICQFGNCVGVTKACFGAGETCRVDACNPSTGNCELVPRTDGIACDDNNTCNGLDACLDGVCASAIAPTFGDNFDSFDSTRWKTVVTGIPQGSANVFQSGDRMYLENRGHLVSARQYDPTKGTVRITGEWYFSYVGDTDTIQILTRSSGIPGGTWGETTDGIECFLANYNAAVTITDRSTGSQVVGAPGGAYVGWYDVINFEVIDDGDSVTCRFRSRYGGSESTATMQTNRRNPKNHIVMHNRELTAWHQAALLNVTIEHGLPKPTHHWPLEVYVLDNITTPNNNLDGYYPWNSFPTGVRGQSLQCLGGGTYAYINNSPLVFGTSDFTIAGWYLFGNQPAGYSEVFGNRTDGSHGPFIQSRISNSGTLTWELDQDYNGTNYVAISTPPTINMVDNQWRHVTLTRSGTTVKLYVDGTQVSSASSAEVTDLTSGSTAYMCFAYPLSYYYGSYMNGSFDDLRIYGKALDACEVERVSRR